MQIGSPLAEIHIKNTHFTLDWMIQPLVLMTRSKAGSFSLISPIQWRHQPPKVGTFGGSGENPPASGKWPQVSPNASQSWFKHLDPFHIYSTRGHNTNRRRVELIGRAKMTSHCDLCLNPMRSPLELCTLGSNLDLKKKKTIVGTQALCLHVGHMF